jgi:predicted DCC family thiol-disulfide oxidoreductase YuxK
MIAWSFLFPQPVHFEILNRFWVRRSRAWTVVYDRRSPLAFFLCRLLVRLDLSERLRFEESAEGPAEPPLLEARSAEGGEALRDRAALAAIARSLPAGTLLWPVTQVLTLGRAGAAFDFMARRRAAVARFFGLTLSRGLWVASAPSPLRARAGRWAAAGREALLAWLLVCALSQALNENKSVPQALKHEQPRVMAATIGYPRMYQGWGMFAPNPITDDGSITVDAITIDGRRIDPFTGAPPDLDLTDARGLGLNQIWQDYFNRIRLDRNKVFRQGLKEYLQRWHLETGRPEDELVAFDVYWVRDQCPQPYNDRPYKNEKIAILTYRKPGYKPPPGAPPLPPEPKVESAGN